MDYRLWSTLEIKLLTMGIMPKGRSPLACRIFCRRNGVKFPGKRACDANDHLIDEIEKKFSQEKDTTMAKAKTSKTITASIKEAKTVKKPAAAKAAKTTPEPEKAEERTYNFRVLDVKNVKASDNIREVKDIDDLLSPPPSPTFRRMPRTVTPGTKVWCVLRPLLKALDAQHQRPSRPWQMGISARTP